MRFLRGIFIAVLIFVATSVAAQNPPIIDMHLHAFAADENGPPPMSICLGDAFPARDAREEQQSSSIY